MAAKKITITLEDDQVELICALVTAGQTPNISKFVQQAVRVSLFDAAGWREMLDNALKQTGGPISKKERAWADAILSPARSRRRARKQ